MQYILSDNTKKQIALAINNADSILVLTGAGMSVDSDLPSYRDKHGFWNDYPLYKEIGKDYISMASPHGFFRDSHFAWGFFAHQHKLYKNATPHSGYFRLLQLLQSKNDFFVVTTNVDGLFLKSGFPKHLLHEAHGSIHRLQCINTCTRNTWSADNISLDIDYQHMRALNPLPLCPTCGSVVRPNIFMYGDTEETYIWDEADKSAQKFREWKVKNKDKNVLIIEIGVGAEGMKKHVKQYYQEFTNATLLRINPEWDDTYDSKTIQMNMFAKNAISQLNIIALESVKYNKKC